MNIQIVCAGHSLLAHERAWMEEYEKRSQRFAKLEIVRVKEKQSKELTWKEMKSYKIDNSTSILLDPKGELLTTNQFAELFKGNLTFYVGGSNGLPDEAKKAGKLISLTPLTLPHRIALLVLLEQVYRVLTLRAGTPYHHA